MKVSVAQTRNLLVGQTCSNCHKMFICKSKLGLSVGTCGLWKKISIDYEQWGLSSEQELINAAGAAMKAAIDEEIIFKTIK